MAEDIIVTCAECHTPFIWPAMERAQGSRPALCPACRRLAPAEGHRRGVVKWFNRHKGFGFITTASGPEIFVHKSGLATGQSSLRVGQLVEFVIRTSSRGAQAEDVVALETDQPAGEAGEPS